MNIRRHLKRITTSTGLALGIVLAAPPAGALNLSDRPLFLTPGAPALNMLTVGRDHKLFTAAYNDASDLNGDGQLDIGYKGHLTGDGSFDYYGYFDSRKCYTYASGLFSPVGATGNFKTCGGTDQWSGDFLNYLTTSRIDALRKVLYGGYRSTDTTAQTVLERAYIPQDAHSWGKEYRSVDYDGYDIRQYTPFSAPPSGQYILFANTTLSSTLTATNYRNPDGPPLLRVRENATHRIWEWVAKDAPVAGDQCATGGDHTTACSGTLTDYTVRVEVCKSGMTEPNCKPKPTGLLHNYDARMAFGLLTGSYMHNKEGGVVRKELALFGDEVQTDGRFASPKKGIVASLDGLKIQDYDGNGNYNHNHACEAGWQESQPDGRCRVWGNPLGEMMFETLRYFSGAAGATSAYTYTDTGSDDAYLGLPQVTTWKNPYAAKGSSGLGYPTCSKPFQTVISDVNPSYDTELPGGYWGGAPTAALPTSISSFSAGTLGQTMWTHEFAGARSIYIGESANNADAAPTPKSATSFGNIRGLSPEEPTKKGSYYSSAVAFFGNTTEVNELAVEQRLKTFAVALSSPLPRIEMPVGSGRISLVPFGKVVKGPGGITTTWQPTNQIAAFYIESMVNMPGQPQDAAVNGGRAYAVFRINFEDAEQGNDYDMDVIAQYTVKVTADGELSVQVKTEYARAGWESHLGYVISGTDGHDGIYLEVAGGGGRDARHPLDTPANVWAGGCAAGACGTTYTLPGLANGASGGGNVGPERLFTPGNAPAATQLNDPLWYAAKYGGFDDKDKDGLPDAGEWDSKVPGKPDNYFLVTNALNLETQLSQVFDAIIDQVSSASSASVNSGSISTESRIYQARFLSRDWSGELLSFQVNPNNGELIATPEWNAATKMPAADARSLFTLGSSGTGMAFNWTAIQNDTIRRQQLHPTDNAEAQKILDYLRGDQSNEQPNGDFRKRSSKLGDIVSSAPLFVGGPAFRYRDTLETAPYSTFRTSNADRTKVVYVGANDGMLHAFKADNVDDDTVSSNDNEGAELFGYVPGAVFKNLSLLTNPSYSHRYYVDGSPNMGDVFYDGAWHTVLVGGLNKGGQGIYALDITNPDSFGAGNVLWEFNDVNGLKGDADLGYTYSRPAIVKLNNGQWAAIFGNGYNNTDADGSASTTGEAALYIVDIKTGARIKKISTGAGSLAAPNGLATPAAVDFDGDSDVDYVYAGDLRGNLWKFNLTSSDKDDWKVAFGTATSPAPFYVALDADGNRQPITVVPEVGRGPNGNGMVLLFGTGKFLEDPTDKQLPPDVARRDQSFYGIYDPNTCTATGCAAADATSGRTNLAAQTIDEEPTFSYTGPDGETASATVRITSANPAGLRGWFMDLVSPSDFQGERVVSNPILRNDRIVFTTLIPDIDPCKPGGSSWLMEMDALTGKRLSESPFDLNRDGKFDDADLALLADGTTKWPASGIKSTVGITPEPGVLTDPSKGIEYKYTPGTSGNIQMIGENPGSGNVGRQSWRQIR